MSNYLKMTWPPHPLQPIRLLHRRVAGAEHQVPPQLQAEDVRDAVYNAYFEDTIGRIMHYVADRGVSEAKKQLTDNVLTVGAHGFENVQAKIEQSIRKSAGRGIVDGEAA
jgi:hypothetical protein